MRAQGGALKLIPCPTPRWPDLLVAYSPSDRLLFTSKLFSAHVRRALCCRSRCFCRWAWLRVALGVAPSASLR